MSVVNGQIANQTTFNNAFLSRTAATTQTVAQLQLENPAVESGAFVGNVQRAVNKAFEGIGATGEADTTINDYATNNYILNGDNRKVAIGKLDAQLKLTQDDLDTAEAAIVVHESRLDQIDIDLADHETRIDAAELTIIDHEDRIDDLESNDMTIGGNKIFSGNVTVQGDFEVQGTLTAINSTDLEVEDQNILVNKNGTDSSAENAGVDIERVTGNAGIRFDSTLASKFKIGLLSNLYEVLVSGIAQSVSGIKDFISGIKVDTINESTLNLGVTVETVLIKDGLVDGRDVGTDGATLDGHTLTLVDHETRIDAAELSITDHENRIDDLEANDIIQDSRLDDLESQDMTIAGNKTFSGNTTLQGSTEIQGDLFVGAVVNVQTGSDQQLTGITSPMIKLTGVGLISVDRIDAPAIHKIISIINLTGADVTFIDNVGSPISSRIRTGLNADVILKNNGIAFLAYDTTSALWYITSVAVAAGGGGGGGGGKKTFDMKLNGAIGGLAAYNNVDGFWIAPSNCQITNVYMYQETVGTTGTTTLDLKIKPYASGAFTSIFLTTPKLTPAAGANAWGGVADSFTGFTTPVLTSLPFAVAAKSAIRMDLIGVQDGLAAGTGLIIEYEEI